MKIEKIAEAALGAYLMLPGPEDAATGGLTVAPSFALGALMVADAFGIKL
jgi:hypothetical protein